MRKAEFTRWSICREDDVASRDPSSSEADSDSPAKVVKAGGIFQIPTIVGTLFLFDFVSEERATGTALFGRSPLA